MPTFAYWPGVIPEHSVSTELVSSMDVLPSLARLVGLPVPDVVLDGKDSLLDIMVSPTGGTSKHDVLFFYNQPAINETATAIFAARAGPWKFHWRTSPGLQGGVFPSHGPAPVVEHDPPLVRARTRAHRVLTRQQVFNVAADVAEAFPVAPSALPPGLMALVTQRKAEYEAALWPRHINMTWGYEFALCCGT